MAPTCSRLVVLPDARGTVPCALEADHAGDCRPLWDESDGAPAAVVPVMAYLDHRLHPVAEPLPVPIEDDGEEAVPEVLCTEEEARRRAAFYMDQVAPATHQLNAFRKATVKATGRRRQALDIFAQMASCRARRSKLWAEAYLQAAELLEDEAEGVREP